MSAPATGPELGEHCAQLVELSIGVLLGCIQHDFFQRLNIKARYRFAAGPGLRETFEKHEQSTKSPSVVTLNCKVDKSRPGPLGLGRQRGTLASELQVERGRANILLREL